MCVCQYVKKNRSFPQFLSLYTSLSIIPSIMPVIGLLLLINLFLIEHVFTWVQCVCILMPMRHDLGVSNKKKNFWANDFEATHRAPQAPPSHHWPLNTQRGKTRHLPFLTWRVYKWNPLQYSNYSTCKGLNKWSKWLGFYMRKYERGEITGGFGVVPVHLSNMVKQILPFFLCFLLTVSYFGLPEALCRAQSS